MRPVKKGSTNQSVVIRIIDSSDGTPENAVEHDTAGIDLWYRREGTTKTSITEAALAALDTAHTDGGIELIGDGYYRLDPPDAAFAAGVNGVMIAGTVTGMIVIGCYIPLVDYDPYNSVRMGMTALPNAAADAAGGVPISDAGGLDLDNKLANTNEITAARMGALTDWINGGRLDLLLDAIPTTAMRGTDNAALASVLGALNDVAAAGNPTDADTLVQYIKQLINVLIGTAGIGTFPAEAAPANAVSLAEVIRAIHVDVTGLNGDAMRGTDGANTTVPDAAGIAATPAEVATALSDINLDHLCKTATAGADMTAEVVDNSILARILANGDTSVFDPTTDGLQLIRDRGDAAWTTGAGGSDRLLMVDTTIANLASQTSFTLTAGSSDDDAYNNCTIVIEDVSTATQKAIGVISAYTGATKTVTLKYDPAVFTMASTDKVYILAENALKTTLANRQLNVAADGDIAGDVDGSVASVIGHTAQTGDSFARLGAPTGASIAADLLAINNFVDDLEGRITAARAGYLDELAAANLPADIDTLLTRITALLATKAEMDTAHGLLATEAKQDIVDTVVDAIKVVTDALTASAATKLALSAGTIVSAAAAAGTLSTTQMTTDLTEVTDDHYNGRIIIWTSGVLKDQATDITDYDGVTKMVTYTAVTEAPSDGDTFNII